MKLNKIIFMIIFLCFSLVIVFYITGCKNDSSNYELPEKENNNEDVEKNMKIKVNEYEFNIILENNETAKSFLDVIGKSKTFTMTELNGNEKYIYLDTSLKTNIVNVKTINKGDIMLYGNNCLVLFYKTFNTSYSYTKIGRISDVTRLEDVLGTKDIVTNWIVE